MTSETDIRRAITEGLLQIAPEADLQRVDPRRSLREQLDIDSFDFLNLLIALNERLHVEVPESDYGRVDSLDALVAYLRQRIPA